MSCYTNQVCYINNGCNPCFTHNSITIYWDTIVDNNDFFTKTSTPASNNYTQTKKKTLKLIYSDPQGKNQIGTKFETQNWWADDKNNFIDNEVNTIQVVFTNRSGVKVGSFYFETTLKSSDATGSAGTTAGRFTLLSGTGVYFGKTGYVDYDAGNNKATFYYK